MVNSIHLTMSSNAIATWKANRRKLVRSLRFLFLTRLRAKIEADNDGK
jgi:hypothetical protein